MRLKLTRLAPVACSMLLLSIADSLPSCAFPFFHRKSVNEQTTPGDQQPSADYSPANSLTAAPAFRPINPAQSSRAPQWQESKTSPPAAPSFGLGNFRITVPGFMGGQPAGSQTEQTGESSSPAIIHSPPALPDRPPIPPPPAVQAPLMVLSGPATPALSWRAVAYKLWITPESLPSRRVKSQSSFPCSSTVALKALIKALNEAGWAVPQFSPSAGHLLAAKPDGEPGSIKLIFAAHPTDGGTVVRAATEPDAKSFDKSQLESIFARAQDIAARNDLL